MISGPSSAAAAKLVKVNQQYKGVEKISRFFGWHSAGCESLLKKFKNSYSKRIRWLKNFFLKGSLMERYYFFYYEQDSWKTIAFVFVAQPQEGAASALDTINGRQVNETWVPFVGIACVDALQWGALPHARGCGG